MSKPIVVHEAARLEHLEATTWYEARRQGLGADLVEATSCATDGAALRVRASARPNTVAGGKLLELWDEVCLPPGQVLPYLSIATLSACAAGFSQAEGAASLKDHLIRACSTASRTCCSPHNPAEV